MLTCRRPVNYAAATLAALREQSAPPVVFADGDADVPADVQLPKRGHTAGIWATFREAVVRGEDLLFLEDDIELSRGAAPYMHDFSVPDDLAFVQFMSLVPAPTAHACLLRMPLDAMTSMFQAVKWPLRTLRRLVDHQPSNPVLWPHELARLLPGERIGVHVPHLVRHVGAVSAIEPTRKPGVPHPQSENFLAPPATVANLRDVIAAGRYR
jgi:hypothetical protein